MGLPQWSSGYDSMLSLQKAQVWSLVREVPHATQCGQKIIFFLNVRNKRRNVMWNAISLKISSRYLDLKYSRILLNRSVLSFLNWDLLTEVLGTAKL